MFELHGQLYAPHVALHNANSESISRRPDSSKIKHQFRMLSVV